MRRIALVLACIVGCQSAPQPSAPLDAPSQPALRVRDGDRHVYAFALRVDETAAPRGLLPTDIPLTSAIDLAGDLVVTVARHDADGTWLAVRIAALTRHDFVALGEALVPDASVLTAHHAWVYVPASGEARRVLVPREAAPMFRPAIEAILSQIDVRIPVDAPAWHAVVRAGHGLADAAYVHDGAAIRRELTGYRRFDATLAVPHDAPETKGTTIIERDADGMPQRIDAHEVLLVPAESFTALQSVTEFSLDRKRIEQGPPVAMPNADAMTELDLFAPPDLDETERAIAQRFAGDMDIDTVQIAIRSLDNGLRPRRGFATEAVGLLRGWPELAEVLEPEFMLAQRTETRELVVDILSSAGTETAQRVMMRLLTHDDVRDDDAYPRYLQRFSFIRRPLPEIGPLLFDLHVQATQADDPRLARAVLYPMGALAASLAPSDPIGAELLHARLADTLHRATDPETTVAALAGIGNARRFAPSTLPLLTSPNARIRLAAVASLRHTPLPAARAALRERLGDHDALVADNARTILETWQRSTAREERTP